MRRPEFLSDRIELHRDRLIEAIRRRNDRPVEIAIREFIKRMAEGHPVGWYPSVETVRRINRDEPVAFHENFYVPQATVIALTGDFEIQVMKELMVNILGDWEPQPVSYPHIPEFNEQPEPALYHVQKDIEQSIILIGHPAVHFDSESYPALSIANRLLGGARDNRLFREIRSHRGLAYSVGSQLTEGFEYPGFFFAYSISRGDLVVEVIELIQAEIERLGHNRSAWMSSKITGQQYSISLFFATAHRN